jgi:tRNA-dihydrouridine synthase
MILAPLRGVTVRCFRRTFAAEIAEAGFTEAVTPFVAANAGADPLKDRELKPDASEGQLPFSVTPQFIGKDPAALRRSLERVKGAGYGFADLNCGCPFPMVRKKGRGSGLMRTPDVLARMLDAGCEVMGERRFSVKTRLGIERTDELVALAPLLNSFPLRRVAVHARTARQMYEGECDWAAFRDFEAASANPVVRNGGDEMPEVGGADVMVGRPFVRHLGWRADAGELLERYAAASLAELRSDRAALGRMKELLAYWREIPRWRAAWRAAKMSRSLAEFMTCLK